MTVSIPRDLMSFKTASKASELPCISDMIAYVFIVILTKKESPLLEGSILLFDQIIQFIQFWRQDNFYTPVPGKGIRRSTRINWLVLAFTGSC